MVTIGPLGEDDHARWEDLFRAYMEFYGLDPVQRVYDRAWREFRSDTRMHALGAWVDEDGEGTRGGALVGITHFLVHPSTTSPDLCYLEDLFTAPAYRGRGVARALIAAVGDWARDHGCGSVYWQTREDNTTARRLYDDVARFEGFVVYTMPLAASPAE